VFKKMSTVLELRALTKDFPTHRAVDAVSLSLEGGEFFSLLGPSGCGKTTTLRSIAGFEQPTSGDILLNGRSLLDLPAYRRDVSTVFQNYALFPHLTVAQNVAFGLERRRFNRPEIKKKVDQALGSVQLAGKESRLPSQLSGGERQRVALARCLAVEPQVLLLDEPLSALDPQLRKQMRFELKALQRRVGITFLFITHDQEEALSLSDRMAVMNGGRIQQLGSPRELYQRPASKFVAEFLGEVNWFRGAGLRPESLRASRRHPGTDVPSVQAAAQGSTFLGNRVHLRAQLLDGSQCTIELDDPRNEFQVGEPITVWWNRSDELQFSEVFSQTS
jgi:ABC-type Fe3+/spermidine/putrescine transport system ATPase subunit